MPGELLWFSWCSNPAVFSCHHLSNSTCDSKELLFRLGAGELPVPGWVLLCQLSSTVTQSGLFCFVLASLKPYSSGSDAAHLSC